MKNETHLNNITNTTKTFLNLYYVHVKFKLQVLQLNSSSSCLWLKYKSMKNFCKIKRERNNKFSMHNMLVVNYLNYC